jgi:hypothetical protein
VGNGFKSCGFNPLNANALDYNKCLRTSASASSLTVKVEIRKMSYIFMDYHIRQNHAGKGKFEKLKE